MSAECWPNGIRHYLRSFRNTTGSEQVPWRPLVITATGILVLSGLAMCVLPTQRLLALFGLYTIPSHMLISVFPHEPALLYVAKLYPALQVMLVATAGACLAGLFDYWLLMSLLSHRPIRRRLEEAPLYHRATGLFQKAPFCLLVIVGYMPVPFFPIKFLSFSNGYPLWKYELALIMGRSPRYLTLAWLGHIVQPPNWVLALLAVAILLLATRKALKQRAVSEVMTHTSMTAEELVSMNTQSNPELAFPVQPFLAVRARGRKHTRRKEIADEKAENALANH